MAMRFVLAAVLMLGITAISMADGRTPQASEKVEPAKAVAPNRVPIQPAAAKEPKLFGTVFDDTIDLADNLGQIVWSIAKHGIIGSINQYGTPADAEERIRQSLKEHIDFLENRAGKR